MTAVAPRIVSLLPAATDILIALGLKHQIVGVSHESAYLPEVSGVPVVSELVYDELALDAGEIDTVVSETYARGQSLYKIDEARLRALAPDLLIAQDLCEVCAITPNDFQRLLGRLQPVPTVLSLRAHTLDQALDDIRRTAEAAGAASNGERLLAALRCRIEAVRSQAERAAMRPRVFCLEWPAPPYNAGHWVPELVSFAGGVEGLGVAGGYSVRVGWPDVRAYDPEIIVAMVCGFPRERAIRELDVLRDSPDYRCLAAVRRGAVWVVDGPRYFSQAGPQLIDGLEILAKILHPEIFGAPSVAEACLFDR